MSDYTIPSPPPKRRGCFFYGCLTSVVLVLLAGLLVFLGILVVGYVYAWRRGALQWV